jgi:hypothetical protein
MPGVAKRHGQVRADSMISGYRQTFFKITNAQRDFSTATVAGSVLTEGGFDKAILAIQKVASITFVAPNEARGIVIAVDGVSAQPTGAAYDSDSTPSVAERIKAEVDLALNTSTTVVAEITLAPSTIS